MRLAVSELNPEVTKHGTGEQQGEAGKTLQRPLAMESPSALLHLPKADALGDALSCGSPRAWLGALGDQGSLQGPILAWCGLPCLPPGIRAQNLWAQDSTSAGGEAATVSRLLQPPGEARGGPGASKIDVGEARGAGLLLLPPVRPPQGAGRPGEPSGLPRAPPGEGTPGEGSSGDTATPSPARRGPRWGSPLPAPGMPCSMPCRWGEERGGAFSQRLPALAIGEASPEAPGGGPRVKSGREKKPSPLSLGAARCGDTPGGGHSRRRAALPAPVGASPGVGAPRLPPSPNPPPLPLAPSRGGGGGGRRLRATIAAAAPRRGPGGAHGRCSHPRVPGAPPPLRRPAQPHTLCTRTSTRTHSHARSSPSRGTPARAAGACSSPLRFASLPFPCAMASPGSGFWPFGADEGSAAAESPGTGRGAPGGPDGGHRGSEVCVGGGPGEGAAGAGLVAPRPHGCRPRFVLQREPGARRRRS